MVDAGRLRSGEDELRVSFDPAGRSERAAAIYFCLGLLLVAALAVGVYSNSFGHSFVYDDNATVIDNRFITDYRNISKFFGRDYFSQASELTYRPVVTLTYMLEYQLWGKNPRAYHATNIILHAANALLVFFLAFSIRRNLFAGLACGLIFASYPVLSETVNAVSFREDLLTTAFFLGALLAHLALGGETSPLKKKLRGV